MPIFKVLLSTKLTSPAKDARLLFDKVKAVDKGLAPAGCTLNFKPPPKLPDADTLCPMIAPVLTWPVSTLSGAYCWVNTIPLPSSPALLPLSWLTTIPKLLPP